jgi:hypothetical protein
MVAPLRRSQRLRNTQPPLLIHEATNKLSHLVRRRVEGEMAGVEDMDFGLKDVAAIRRRLRNVERRIVSAP